MVIKCLLKYINQELVCRYRDVWRMWTSRKCPEGLSRVAAHISSLQVIEVLSYWYKLLKV